MTSPPSKETRDRFLAELRHHLKGWMAKFREDFCEKGFTSELRGLEGDPVYARFGFANPEYVLIRLMGRASISIGRRLGEIYDKIPRFITAARFELHPDDVAAVLPGGLELDVCIPLAKLSPEDRLHVQRIAKQHLNCEVEKGIAIEIRYNFNPNDSARLRKDVEVAEHLGKDGFLRVYLVFSAISPRDEAIARLTRAGWRFLVGEDAAAFMKDLIGMDFNTMLDDVREELHKEVAQIMEVIYKSYAVSETLTKYRAQS